MTRTRTRCAQSPCTTSFYISPRSPYISAISLSRCAQSPCTIRDLPAGTPALVKVNAWGQAGEGEPSEFVAAQTEDSDYSRECRETLLAKADGSYVAPGTVPPPNPDPDPPRSPSPTREHTRKHTPGPTRNP